MQHLRPFERHQSAFHHLVEQRQEGIDLFFRVADLETHVRRNVQRGMDEAEIGPDDLGAGIQICEVDRPDACACAYVEDVLGIGVDGGEVQLAVEGEAEEMVLQVETVLFETIVWEDIFAVFKAVVESAIFLYNEVAMDKIRF